MQSVYLPAASLQCFSTGGRFYPIDFYTVLADVGRACLIGEFMFKPYLEVLDRMSNKETYLLKNFCKDMYESKSTLPIVVEKKPGRNEKCLCGSGLKYKFCCIDKASPANVS